MCVCINKSLIKHKFQAPKNFKFLYVRYILLFIYIKCESLCFEITSNTDIMHTFNK